MEVRMTFIPSSGGATKFVSGISGAQATSEIGFVSIGAFSFSSTTYPGTQAFEAIIEATALHTAEIRLFDIAGSAAVAGSTLSSAANVPTVVTGAVSLGAPTKTYEVQLRMTTSGSESDQVICKSAGIRLS
jgi:hypothetical protein